MLSNKVFRVLKSPASAVREMLTHEVDLKIPVMIVLFTGALFGAVGIISENEFNARILLSSTFFTFIIWILLSTIVFIISRFIKGGVSYLKNIEVIGYAYSPIALGLIFQLISLIIFGMGFWPLYSILSASWSLVIMIFVVREVNEISTIQSLITIMVAFFMVMTLYWFLVI